MINNNNNDNTEDNSKSPVVDALRRHFNNGNIPKELIENQSNTIITRIPQEEVKKIITVKPLGFRNAR